MLAAWAARYIDPAPVTHSNLVCVRETHAGKFQQAVTSGRHALLADEPEEVEGGGDAGPSPYDYLAVALGACTSMTLRMYADHKKLKLGRITVTVDHDNVHAQHCADCGYGREGRIDRFERVIAVEGDIDPRLQGKLIEIAGKCPVHRTLEASAAVVTRLAEPAHDPNPA